MHVAHKLSRSSLGSNSSKTNQARLQTQSLRNRTRVVRAQKRKEKKPRRKCGAQKRKKKPRRNADRAALDALVLASAGGADHIVSTGGSSPGLYQNPTETKDQCISAVLEPWHRVWLEPPDGRSYPPADSTGDDACLDFEGLEEDAYACWDAEDSEKDDGDAEGGRC